MWGRGLAELRGSWPGLEGIPVTLFHDIPVGALPTLVAKLRTAGLAENQQ